MKKTLMTLCGAALLAFGGDAKPAQAQNFWLGQIVAGGWNFCPRSTVAAKGQLLSISQFSALFSLLGTNYGGDGRTTFGVPNLQGRAPIGEGTLPGGGTYRLGQTYGQEVHTLNQLEMPSHTHAVTATGNLNATNGAVNSATAAGSAIANQPASHYSSRGAINEVMKGGSVSVTASAANTGGSQAHETRGPRQVVTYCIVTEGIFPSRS